MGRPRKTLPGQFEEFGERLKRAFNEHGWGNENYNQTGARLGVSGPTIGNWLNGIKLPSTAHAILVATETGVDLHWLLTGEEPMRRDRTAKDSDFINIGHLPPEKQAALKATADLFNQPLAKPDKLNDG